MHGNLIMSRISKAVELARKEGNFLNGDVEANEINRVSTSPFHATNLQKVETDINVLKKNHVLSAVEDDKILDTYRLLRTRVLRRMRQNKWKSLGITSAGKNDGKTITAINLGISIAMKQNHTVVIVDADFRNPSISKAFGFEPELGLSDYLTSDISLDKVLINPGIEGLVLLPGSKHPHSSSELLSSLKMTRLAKDLKMRYQSQIIIYDLPPVLVGDDVAAFAPNLDSVLLVVEEGSTDKRHLKKSIDLLEGVEIIGTILNKSNDGTHNGDYYY